MNRMRWALGLMMALACLLRCDAVEADIYRWTDGAGVTHFTNTPPPPGASLIERIEEAPYDAEADRSRQEEERRLRLERQKQALEDRQTALDQREREAQLKLEDAERRLEQVEQQAQETVDRERDDCDDYFLRYGSCGYSGYGVRYHRPAPGPRDLYRGYYRKDGSLYRREPPKPGPPPSAAPPRKPDGRSKVNPLPPRSKPKGRDLQGPSPAAPASAGD
jgi:type II secretory pathway component PulJ